MKTDSNDSRPIRSLHGTLPPDSRLVQQGSLRHFCPSPQALSPLAPSRGCIFLAAALSLFVGLAIECRADDTLLTAQDLGVLVGTVQRRDFVGPSDTVDYFRFTVTGSVRKVTVQLGGLSDWTWVELIEDADGNWLVDSGEVLASGSSYSSVTLSLWLDPGTYYVRVRPYSSGDSTEYTLTLAETARPESPGRADNTLGGARNLGVLNGVVTVADFVGTSDTVDYFRFTVTGSVRKVTVQLGGLSDWTWVELIEDANGNWLVDSGEVLASGSSYSSVTLSLWLDPGTYYVRVRPYSSGDSTEYTLTLAETARPESPGRADNTLAGARNLGVLNGVVTVADFVGTSDTVDYFRFTVTGSVRKVTVQLVGPSDWTWVELIEDANGNWLVDSGEVLASGYSSSSVTLSLWLDPGTYYVRVRPYFSGYSTEYTLTLTETARAESPGRADNTLAGARNLGVLNGVVTVADFVGTSDTVDYFRFTVTGSVRKVTVQLVGPSDWTWVELIEDANGNWLVDSGEVLASGYSSSSVTLSLWLDPGTYYVRVRPYFSGYSTEYTLTLAETARAESPGRADNTLGGARNLGVLNGVVTVGDFVGTSDTVDYFRFTVTGQRREVTVQLVGPSDWTWVELIEDANGNWLVDSGEVLASGYSSSSVTLSLWLDPGTYYVRVRPYFSGYSTEYTLTLSIPAVFVTLTLYVHEENVSGPLLPGVRVTGNDAAGQPFDQTTGTGGYVTITGTPGTWSFTASKAGYDPNSWSQAITATSERHAYLFRVGPPQVVVEPVKLSLNGGQDATFTATVRGEGPFQYQWFKDGSALPGQTGPVLTWRSVGVTDSGRYEVVVRDASGRSGSAAATLSVLLPGSGGQAQERIEVSPSLPPAPQGSSLVLITHGWSLFGGQAGWIDTMADAIRQKLEARGQRNWVVVPVHWESQAKFAVVLSVAETVGTIYGKEFAKNHWSHIHLIAHSAGSAFIEEFARQIKKVWGNQTTIHSTFLDAFEGFLVPAQDYYGTNADWADAYFSRDWTGLGVGLTGGRLRHAHAVDVTSATGEWVEQPVFCGIIPRICSYKKVPQEKTDHGYPIEFYLKSIRGELPACVGEYGFALSQEAGGWANRVGYPVNNQPVHLCAEPLPSSGLAVRTDRPLNLAAAALAAGPGAAFSLLGEGGFRLGRAQLQIQGAQPSGADESTAPVWVAVTVEATNRVNYVQFEAAFISDPPGEGLLSVYWYTNRIGFLDERVDTGALRTWQFELPGEYPAGVYTLSFQLDTFGGRDATVTVTNVILGFAGLSEPARLEWMGWTTNGLPVLMLSAPAPSTFQVLSSTNLVDWEGLAWLVNTNGTVVFTDSAATNAARRFYRAVLR